MITPQQVTAMLAQQATAVNIYPSRDVNGELLEGWALNLNGDAVYIGTELGTRGIGIFGQSMSSLVLTGYVKPAALDLIVDISLVSTVLGSPAVWSGLNGMNSLLEYLSNEDLQTRAQVDLMLGAYQGLLDAGVFTGTQGAKFEATFLQPAARFGVEIVIAWITGQVDSGTATILNTAARQGQYAIDFIGTNITAIDTVPSVPGFVNTTVRQTIDDAAPQALGEKIPVPNFGGEITTTPIANVALPSLTNEDGTFRFAPGKPKG